MAECGPIDVSCKTSEALNGVTDGITEDIKAGVEVFVEGAFTGWLNMPVPIIGEQGGVVEFLRGNLQALVVMLLVFAIIVFAGKLIFKPDAETIRNFGTFGFRVVVVTGGSIYIGGQLILMADGYSTWIIDKATEGDGLGTSILNMFQITGPQGFFIAVIFGVVASLASIVQAFLLAARNVMLPILIAVAPVAVAVSNTEMGKSWWTKYVSWFTAFLLYKPTAATIYAAGFWMLSKGNILGSTTVGEAALAGMNFVYGAMLLFMAIFAFKALMNVVTPITGKLTGGMAGAGMMAVTGAALLATGAVGRAVSGVSAAAPTTVTPLNAAAGAPGPTGSTGNPGGGGNRWRDAGKYGTDSADHARQGFSDSINNDKDDQ